MSKLLSCFWQKKKERDCFDLPPQGNVRRSRRLSKKRNDVPVVFVETGELVDKNIDDQRRFNGNVRNVYRTETITQKPQYENVYEPSANRQSRSYPVSPERRSLYKVYSFEQQPSFEKQKLVGRKDSRDSRSLMIYAANVNPVLPRFGKIAENSDNSFPLDVPINDVPRRSINHGAEYEKEVSVPKVSARYVAEKPAEDYLEPASSKDKSDPPIVDKENDRNFQGNLRRLKEDDEHFSPRSSRVESPNAAHLAIDNTVTRPKYKTVVRARPQSSKSFALGNSVKQMVYRAEDVARSPMSARFKSKSQPPLLATADGKILRPFTPDNIKRLSTSSNQPIKLSVVRPVEAIESFPLAQGGEMIVAAPMIGGRRGGKAQNPKSILRKGKGGSAQRRGGPPPEFDDYGDYEYENDYGAGHYGQAYYDEGSDMYPFAPVDDAYSYGSRGGYYDDGYGYPDEGYGRGPVQGRGGRQGRQQIYAAQMPDITLPTTSVDKGKNPAFKKTGKPPEALDSCFDKKYYEMKNEKIENKDQFAKEHKVKLISSAQQTDLSTSNELDFICFSPDRCFKTSDMPDDPNSKLRWRIIIKRGDED